MAAPTSVTNMTGFFNNASRVQFLKRIGNCLNNDFTVKEGMGFCSHSSLLL